VNLQTRDFNEICLQANDYRAFLNCIFSLAEEKDPRFSFASFSRKAGFTSRGFVKEVLTGRKRLTAYSFPRFVKALGITGVAKQYFTTLVALEEEELNSDRLTQEQLKDRLAQLRTKANLHLQTADSPDLDTAPELYKDYQVLEVVSVLGNREKGASFEQVIQRTGLEPYVAANILRQLISKKIVREVNGRYISVNPHFVFDHLGEKSGFKEVYIQTLQLVRRKIASHFSSRDYLFVQSYFSVDRKRLPELKERMRELIHEFVQTHENDDGDCVAKLHVALIR
jgi:uncharacterized protein (TIGR02147 family)